MAKRKYSPEDEAEIERKITELEVKEKINLEIINPNKIPQHIKDQIDLLVGETSYLDRNPITKQQLEKLKKSAGILTSGYKSSGMICSSNCLLKVRCPLFILETAPYQLNKVNEECPVEQNIIDGFFENTISNYAERHNLDINDVKSDMFVSKLIKELSQLELYENRINTSLGEQGLVIDEAKEINEMGEVITNKKLSPLFEMLKYISTRRSYIYKTLLLTPEMELKKKITKKYNENKETERVINNRIEEILGPTLMEMSRKEINSIPIGSSDF